MKRSTSRLLSTLLVLCMVLALLPSAALASPWLVTNYDELVQLWESGSYGYVSSDFDWTGAPDTVVVPTSCVISVYGDSWEIPEGITLYFDKYAISGISCKELIINGTIRSASSTQRKLLTSCNKVVIGPTATFSCEDDKVSGQYISSEQTWEVQKGAVLNADIFLDGTLTGEGTVSGEIKAYSVTGSMTSTTATISGNLTITNRVSVGWEYGDDYIDTLTIPAGSNITLSPEGYGGIEVAGNDILKVDGTLKVSGGNPKIIFSPISLSDGGKMEMGEGSVVAMYYPHEIGGGRLTTAPAAPFITGNGTIKYYRDDGNTSFYSLFYRDIDDIDSDPSCFDGYIENTVTIWRSWATSGTPSTPSTPKVQLSDQNLTVDGVKKDCEKYNIGGSNYFKLRDLAYMLSGTGSQFEVGYDFPSDTVTITTGKPYTPNGSEMVIGEDKSGTAKPTDQTVMIDGVVVDKTVLSIYNIGGNNYFKLRDLGDALGFGVDYDFPSDTAIVRSR